jgi:hypothetical protein
MKAIHLSADFPVLLTEHARQRCQQRGIPLRVLELAMTYGDRRSNGDGKKVIYFGKNAASRARKAGHHVSTRPNIVLVVNHDETAIVTVARYDNPRKWRDLRKAPATGAPHRRRRRT